MSLTPPKDSNANFRPTSSASWSLEDIHENASNWSLEGDSKLLEFMQNISKNLENRCTTTQGKINKMKYDLNRTSLRLENTTNKMLSLKNLQFMEARVHDETEVSTNTASSNGGNDSTKNKADKNETSTFEAVKIAVEHGLNMLNDCYEKVTLKLDEDSDEDDDLVQQSTVFRAKNPHNDRPLPHLIGSEKWTQKWHIGLLESDDDMSNDDENVPEEFSESSTDDDTISRSVSLPSNTVSDSDYSFTQQSHNTQYLSGRANIDLPFESNITVKAPSHIISTNIFDESDDEVQSTKPPVSTVHATETPHDIRPQEGSHSNRIHSTVDPVSSFFPQAPSKPSSVPVLPLFDDEPPALNMTVAQPRKPLNLFMDSDDDDDMFQSQQPVTSTRPSTSKAQKPLSAARTNIFDDDSDPDYTTGSTSTKAPNPVPPTTSNILNLFNDSPPDDLFDVLISKKTTVPKTKVNIFDDEADIFATDKSAHISNMSVNDSIRTRSENQTNNNQVKTAVAKQSNNIFEDSEDDSSDIFAPLPKKPVPTSTKPFQPISGETVASNGFNNAVENLRQDQPPRASIPSNVNSTASEAITSKPVLKTNIITDIFGDEQPPDDDFNDIFGYGKRSVTSADKSVNIASKVVSGSLFGDESDDDSSIFTTQNKIDEVNKNHILSDGQIEQSDTRNLFGGDIEDDVIKTTPNENQLSNNNVDTPDILEDVNRNEIVSTSKTTLLDNELEKNIPLSKSSNGFDDFFHSEQMFEDTSDNVKHDDSLDRMFEAKSKIEIVSNTNATPHEEPVSFSEDIASTNKPRDPPIGQAVPNHILRSGLFDDFPPDDTYKPTQSYTNELDNDFAHEDLPTGSQTKISFDKEYSSEIPSAAETSTKTISNHLSFGLFDDMPPDDDFLPATSQSNKLLKTSIFDDTTPDDEDEMLTNEPSLKTTNSVPFGLFDDLPPDDDLFVQTVNSTLKTGLVQKNEPVLETTVNPILPSATTHSNASVQQNSVPSVEVKTTTKTLFYEDFAETILPPLPQDNISKLITPSDSVCDETDRATNFKDKLTKFTEPSSDWSKPEIASDVPKPRKLKDNFNINVAALLPGAKRPQAKESVVSSPGDLHINADDKVEDNENLSSLATSTKSAQEDSSRLVGLNKGRAKIAVKRRPSTRKGRQEEYRKSLLVQTEEDQPNEEEKLNEQGTASNPLASTASIADMLNNYKPEDLLFRPSINPSSTATLSIKSDDTSKTIANDWFPNTDTSTTFRKMTPKPKTTNPQKLADTKRIPVPANIFSDEDDDDDLFASIKSVPIAKQPNVPLKSQLSSQRVSQPLPTVGQKIKSSLFGDEDDNDDDLFGQTNKTKPSLPSVQPPKTMKSTSLFGDFDDDEDDLFSSASKKSSNIKKASASVPKQTSNPSSTTRRSTLDKDPLSDLL